eukprot:764827-Hanusia_phi.AAC.2
MHTSSPCLLSCSDWSEDLEPSSHSSCTESATHRPAASDEVAQGEKGGEGSVGLEETSQRVLTQVQAQGQFWLDLYHQDHETASKGGIAPGCCREQQDLHNLDDMEEEFVSPLPQYNMAGRASSLPLFDEGRTLLQGIESTRYQQEMYVGSTSWPTWPQSPPSPVDYLGLDGDSDLPAWFVDEEPEFAEPTDEREIEARLGTRSTLRTREDGAEVVSASPAAGMSEDERFQSFIVEYIERHARGIVTRLKEKSQKRMVELKKLLTRLEKEGTLRLHSGSEQSILGFQEMEVKDPPRFVQAATDMVKYNVGQCWRGNGVAIKNCGYPVYELLRCCGILHVNNKGDRKPEKREKHRLDFRKWSFNAKKFQHNCRHFQKGSK